MKIAPSEAEDSVVGFGLEENDGSRHLCLQTKRADGSTINQLVIKVEDLHKQGKIEYQVPNPSSEDIRHFLTKARFAYPLDQDKQGRYMVDQAMKLQGAVLYESKEFPVSWASMLQIEYIVNLYRQETLTGVIPDGNRRIRRQLEA